MKQTSKIECPRCKAVQEEDIHDMAMDTGELDGTYTHVCEECEVDFTVEFEYRPYIKTY